MPRPDFPQTILQFQSRFGTEEACQKYLYESRWPDGFVCPSCGDRNGYWIKSRILVQCTRYKHQVSLTARTVMHRSKQPLRLWFWAAYLVMTKTPGISALQLQRQLGLTRYETAFNMLHKLRAATVRPQRDRLVGHVEVDEAFIGGVASTKSVVVAAVEHRTQGAGRIRMRQLRDTTTRALIGFVRDAVEPRSHVFTDGLKAYRTLWEHGYEHHFVVQSETGEPALPLVHLIFSNLKAWLQGTFHGAVRHQHLQAYLNEFVFRFNRRKTPMAAFQTILGIGSHATAPTYKGLYTGTWGHPNPKARSR